jgi:hypothetical protein
MTRSADLLTAARAEALFTSDISASSQPSPVEVAAAIRQAVRRYGGTRGCAAEVAAAYGDRPETAAPRMRWARGVVETAYTRQTQQPAADSRSNTLWPSAAGLEPRVMLERSRVA